MIHNKLPEQGGQLWEATLCSVIVYKHCSESVKNLELLRILLAKWLMSVLHPALKTCNNSPRSSSMLLKPPGLLGALVSAFTLNIGTIHCKHWRFAT